MILLKVGLGDGFRFTLEFELLEKPLLELHLDNSSNFIKAWFVSRIKMSSILFCDFYKNSKSFTTSFWYVFVLIECSSLFTIVNCCDKYWFIDDNLFSSFNVFWSSWITTLGAGISLTVSKVCCFIGECLKITFSCGFPSNIMFLRFSWVGPWLTIIEESKLLFWVGINFELVKIWAGWFCEVIIFDWVIKEDTGL